MWCVNGSRCFGFPAQYHLPSEEGEDVVRYHAVLDAPGDLAILNEIGQVQGCGKIPCQGIGLSEADKLFNQDPPADAAHDTVKGSVPGRDCHGAEGR